MSAPVPKFAEIILPLKLPNTLTYAVPMELQATISVGMRVEVALKGNKYYAGIVAALHDITPQQYKVQLIRALLDQKPILSTEQLQFWHWVAQYYVSSLGDVMNAALPAHLKLSNETRLEWVGHEDDSRYDWSEKTLESIAILKVRKEITLSELRQLVGAKALPIVIQELIDNECVYLCEGLEPTYRPKVEKLIRLNADYAEEEALHKLFDQLNRAPKQLELLMAYFHIDKQKNLVPVKELLQKSKANASQLKSLVDKGVFEIEEQNIDRLPFKLQTTLSKVVLSAAQQVAFEQLESALKGKDVALLQGLTGSGKTLLYIKLINQYISQGKQCLFLLPEIALTTQIVQRLTQYFGADLGVYHSRFSQNERIEIWEKVKLKKYKVILGTRSALWLPFNQLGLIVVDEEHENSYKQHDPAPRFHARDAAIILAHFHQAKVVLGSATPSVESLYNVQQNKYAFVKLSERYNDFPLPQIQFLPYNQNSDKRTPLHSTIFQEDLIQAIEQTLKNNKQVILFQNKRGYSPFQICMHCGWVPYCAQCSVSLTYHKPTDKLHCHYCSSRYPVMHQCLQCGAAAMQSKSYGTQKIEEEAKRLFPTARILRMDYDTTRGKASMAAILDKLNHQHCDILIGTQMLVKGLDFPHIALVGVLHVDALMHYPDFRVHEKAFQLLCQLAGRAGRSNDQALVILQGHNFQHPLFSWIAQADIKSFYLHEIQYRKEFNYPPYCRLIKISFRHKTESKALDLAQTFADRFKQYPKLHLQGPVAAAVAKIKNLFHFELWLKHPSDQSWSISLKRELYHQSQQLLAQRTFSNAQIVIDVDPLS